MPFALGLCTVAALLWAAGSFSRASVGSVKALLAWVAALAGLGLLVLLVLTGRGTLVLSGLIFGAPLAWTYWQQRRGAARAAPPPPPRLSRSEAYAVLGLPDGASDSDVQGAWVRLMRAVHPDGGGTDWLAARVNAARDVLLQR